MRTVTVTPASGETLGCAQRAASRGLPVITQDDDFDVLAELGLLEVIRV